jgi:hypothetical protein
LVSTSVPRVTVGAKLRYNVGVMVTAVGATVGAAVGTGVGLAANALRGVEITRAARPRTDAIESATAKRLNVEFI